MKVREMKTNVMTLLLGLVIIGMTTGCQSTTPISLNSFKPPAEANAFSSNQNTAALITLDKTEQLNKIVQQAPGVVLVDFYADWCKPEQDPQRA